MKSTSLTLLVAVGLLAGCATTPPPNEQMTQAQAAVSKAEGAQSYELAPVEFNTAQQKLQRARAAFEQREYVQARRLAEEAEVDANLAYMKARSSQAQQAVRELQQSIEVLRKEMEPGS